MPVLEASLKFLKWAVVMLKIGKLAKFCGHYRKFCPCRICRFDESYRT